ncbi:MAG TPA: TolC family protein [Terracidiphilus sp.]|nr:TolC family protein [Terracidiphilus sp.]
MRTTHNSRHAWLPPLVGAVLAAAAAAAPAQVSLTTVVELAQKNSVTVHLAQSDVQKATAELAQSRDAFIPSLSFDSGLPAFPELGFTGSLPTIWGGTVQSLVFSMPGFQYVHAAQAGVRAAQLALKDAREQAGLDASSAYIELDAVNHELEAARQQEQDAARLVEIEQQRAEAGVDPLSTLLQAQLTAAQLKLGRLHLETRAATLAEQLATLTGLPVGSMTPDHASIPEIPAVTGDLKPTATPGIESAQQVAVSRQHQARGDEEHLWLLPEVGFGLLYNRNTTLLNDINNYYRQPLPANNLSTGFSIKIPVFDSGLHAKMRASAADALRARVEVEQAQQQNDVQIAQLSASLRELDAQAEIASLKQQIASEQLKSVEAQLELGNGAGNGPGAPPQLSPTAQQQARIDERQNYIDALDAGLILSKARLNLLRALGHMQDWLNELHPKP